MWSKKGHGQASAAHSRCTASRAGDFALPSGTGRPISRRTRHCWHPRVLDFRRQSSAQTSPPPPLKCVVDRLEADLQERIAVQKNESPHRRKNRSSSEPLSSASRTTPSTPSRPSRSSRHSTSSRHRSPALTNSRITSPMSDAEHHRLDSFGCEPLHLPINKLAPGDGQHRLSALKGRTTASSCLFLQRGSGTAWSCHGNDLPPKGRSGQVQMKRGVEGLGHPRLHL